MFCHKMLISSSNAETYTSNLQNSVSKQSESILGLVSGIYICGFSFLFEVVKNSLEYGYVVCVCQNVSSKWLQKHRHFY